MRRALKTRRVLVSSRRKASSVWSHPFIRKSPMTSLRKVLGMWNSVWRHVRIWHRHAPIEWLPRLTTLMPVAVSVRHSHIIKPRIAMTV